MNCNTKNKNKNYETLTGRHSALKQRYETVRRCYSALFARNILYDADVANNLAIKRRKDKKSYKFNENIKIFIEKLLGGTPLVKQYSPEQIVGILKKKT